MRVREVRAFEPLTTARSRNPLAPRDPLGGTGSRRVRRFAPLSRQGRQEVANLEAGARSGPHQ